MVLAAEALASRIEALHGANPAETSTTELLAHAPEQMLMGIAAACRGELQMQLTCSLPEILHPSAVRCAIQQPCPNPFALPDTPDSMLHVPLAHAQTGKALVTALESVPEVTRLQLRMDPREAGSATAPDGKQTDLVESGVLAVFDGLPATAVTVGSLRLCLLLAEFCACFFLKSVPAASCFCACCWLCLMCFQPRQSRWAPCFCACCLLCFLYVHGCVRTGGQQSDQASPQGHRPQPCDAAHPYNAAHPCLSLWRMSTVANMCL